MCGVLGGHYCQSLSVTSAGDVLEGHSMGGVIRHII